MYYGLGSINLATIIILYIGAHNCSNESVWHVTIYIRIDINTVIKVADFGLSENMEKEYFRQDQTSGIKLPLKWMAPESMEFRVFSEKSDVVRKLYYSYLRYLLPETF